MWEYNFYANLWTETWIPILNLNQFVNLFLTFYIQTSYLWFKQIILIYVYTNNLLVCDFVYIFDGLDMFSANLKWELNPSIKIMSQLPYSDINTLQYFL